MYVYFNKATEETNEFLDIVRYGKKNHENWYFTFVGRDYKLGLKILYFAKIGLTEQSIETQQQSLCCGCYEKNVWTVKINFSESGWDNLFKIFEKREIYFQVMCNQIRDLVNIFKFPFISKDNNLYNIDLNDSASMKG